MHISEYSVHGTSLFSTILPTGYSFLRNPWINKGSSFTEDERNELGLHGLLPSGEQESLETKREVAMDELRTKTTSTEKCNYLLTLQDSDETLFHSMIDLNRKETTPFLETPVMGSVCRKWSKLYRHRSSPRGLYIAVKDIDRIESILSNYPSTNIKVITLTDGETIPGFGDLGANAMGIPIGKLALATAFAGIHPEEVLPVTIDVGTNTDSILNDPAYIGIRQKRDRSENYDKLIDQLIATAQKVYGRSVVFQFVGFSNSNTVRIQDRCRSSSTSFNDDIQGTASVVLAGLLASNQLTGKNKLSEHRFLFLGTGETGTGIANLIASAIVQQSPDTTLKGAKEQSFFVDSSGLVCSDRKNLEQHNLPFAHDLKTLLGYYGPGFFLHPCLFLSFFSYHILLLFFPVPSSLSEAVDVVKPTAIIGVSAEGGAFTKDIIEKMSHFNERPLIFALSNPSNKAECTAAEAYTHSKGMCVFASGSPFDPVILSDGKQIVPGHATTA
jgi:malate dehydrogenase (oxaloacetate-decarboxylating)(NADP+)